MKALTTSDVFAAMRIVKAAQFSDEVAKIGAIVQSGKQVNMQELGLQFVLRCIEKCAGTEAEKAIYAFLGNLLEMTPGEIANADPLIIFEELSTYADAYMSGEENKKRVTAFFGSLAKLTH